MSEARSHSQFFSHRHIYEKVSKQLAVLRLLRWALAGVVLLQLLWIFPSSVEEMTVDEGPDAGGGQVLDQGQEFEQKMRNLKLVEADSRGKQWELNADVATRKKGQSEWLVETVRIRFFGTNGVVFYVTGDRAGLIQPNHAATSPSQATPGQMWIQGNVRTVSSNGYKFRSESLNYSQVSRHLWSEVPVQMESPPEKDGSVLQLKGERMKANLVSNEMSLEGDVFGTRQQKNGTARDKMNISSEKAFFSAASRSARFSENVMMEYLRMQVRGPEARFVFSQGQDQLESIFVTGGVRLSDAKRVSSSGTLHLLVAEERITLQGSPRVLQGQDELIGDEIVFLKGGKQVQVLNAKAQFNSDQNSPEQEKRQ